MKAIISLASNYGDKEAFLKRTVEEISKICDIIEYSGEYLTEPTDGTSAPYLNAVAIIESDDKLENLNKEFKQIEIRLGRDEESRRLKQVPCDIDIVEADGEVLRLKDSLQDYYRIGLQRLTLQKR